MGTKSVPQLYSGCLSEVDGQDGAVQSEAPQGLGLERFNIFISDLIDGRDYAYYTCRQHQLGSELRDKVGIQNDRDKAQKWHEK